jgi:Ser/Thr protein kinase RdoA (MazF antagonist)
MIPVPIPVLNQITADLGIDPAALIPLGGGREDSDGITYSYPSPSGERVLKILAIPDSAAGGLSRLNERLKFAHFLAQNGVEIVYPLDLAGGGLVTTHRVEEQCFAAYIMEKGSGSHPGPDAWTAEFTRQWGRTVGRLHRVTQQYPTWQHSLDPQGQPFLGWQEEWQGFYNGCTDPEVKQAWISMRQQLERLPVDRGCFGFIHNDPHIQNILFDGQRIILLDFDVANYHWFACDIAIACQALLFARTGGMERPLSDPAPLLAFLRDFRAGYEQENDLEPSWWEHIDLFIQYRRILLFTVMQGWLDTVPETRASWKDMILKNEPLWEK